MLTNGKEAITEVALEALLPQRRPMLLLDAVLAGDTHFAVTCSIVRPEWPLAGETGVDALVLIEIAAQTAGISCSWGRLQQKGPDSEQKGWIVAIKRAELHLAELPFEERRRLAEDFRQDQLSAEDIEYLRGNIVAGGIKGYAIITATAKSP